MQKHGGAVEEGMGPQNSSFEEIANRHATRADAAGKWQRMHEENLKKQEEIVQKLEAAAREAKTNDHFFSTDLDQPSKDHS